MIHGSNVQLYDFKLEYTFQDNAMAELDRQLALLLSTQVGTMPAGWSTAETLPSRIFSPMAASFPHSTRDRSRSMV